MTDGCFQTFAVGEVDVSLGWLIVSHKLDNFRALSCERTIPRTEAFDRGAFQRVSVQRVSSGSRDIAIL